MIFLQLFKKNDCKLQIGGSDQWGNIVNGVDLIRRMTQKESFGLTSPLITTATGSKMGKTEKGAIWLNEKLLPAYDYWQFWRNTDDRDVKSFLNFFTEIPINEIDELFEKEKNINKLKILLANEATTILHGAESALKAEKTAKATFSEFGVGSELPEISLKSDQLKAGLKIVDFLSMNKITTSKSEARRIINNKGLKIENTLVTNDKSFLKIENFNKNILKISIGKKKHYIIKII